jgi:hypothetical protein
MRATRLIAALCSLALATSCVEILLQPLLPEAPANYPKLRIHGPSLERKITTRQAAVRICGTIETRKPKAFLFEITVKNRANGRVLRASAVNNSIASTMADWCTPQYLLLEPGKNSISACSRPKRACNGIIITREEAP